MVNLIPVAGLEDPALDIFTKLSEVQLKRFYEPAGGLFIAESPKVVLRALDAGCKPVSLLVEDRHVEGEAREVLARCRELAPSLLPEGGVLPAYVGPYEVLTKLTGYALTRGVLCAMRRPPLLTPEDVLRGNIRGANTRGMVAKHVRQGSAQETAPEDVLCGIMQETAAKDAVNLHRGGRRIAVLENVMNPANVGAIFRNAAALGIDGILLTCGCSDPLYRRTLRVSMGTALQIPWAWFGRKPEDWKQTGMAMLKSEGFHTVAMALREDAMDIHDLHLDAAEKAAILLGAEGDGLLPETVAGADSVVMIPMMRGVDSLNVAAASAVAFFTFVQT